MRAALLVACLSACHLRPAVAPIAPEAPGDVLEIVAGEGFFCARTVERRVKCWGQNINGQLGNGTDVDSAAPTLVPELTEVEQLGAAGNFACALAKRRVHCWGYISDDGWPHADRLPHEIELPAQAIALSVAESHGCARLANGTVACWGKGYDGRLGNGVSDDYEFRVHQLSELKNVAELTVGLLATCARTDFGEITCFGPYAARLAEAAGESIEGSAALWKLEKLRGGRVLTVDDTRSCVLDAEGELLCTWTNDGTLRPFLGLDRVRDAFVLGNETCVHLSDGGIRCWPRFEEHPTARIARDLMEFGAGATFARVGDETCALKFDRTLWCWTPKSKPMRRMV